MMIDEFKLLLKSLDPYYQYSDDFMEWERQNKLDRKAKNMISAVQDETERQEYQKLYTERMRKV